MLSRLSFRELSIVLDAAEGLSDKEIAARLGITLGTVRSYWDRTHKKLGTVNRAHAVAVVIRAQQQARMQILHPPGSEHRGAYLDGADVRTVAWPPEED